MNTTALSNIVPSTTKNKKETMKKFAKKKVVKAAKSAQTVGAKTKAKPEQKIAMKLHSVSPVQTASSKYATPSRTASPPFDSPSFSETISSWFKSKRTKQKVTPTSSNKVHPLENQKKSPTPTHQISTYDAFINFIFGNSNNANCISPPTNTVVPMSPQPSNNDSGPGTSFLKTYYDLVHKENNFHGISDKMYEILKEKLTEDKMRKSWFKLGPDPGCHFIKGKYIVELINHINTTHLSGESVDERLRRHIHLSLEDFGCYLEESCKSFGAQPNTNVLNRIHLKIHHCKYFVYGDALVLNPQHIISRSNRNIRPSLEKVF